MRLTVYAFAALVAVLAFGHSHDALLVIDGHAYMEMAKAMATHGDLEVRNALDRIDSVELYIGATVKIGPHIYGKYPPLYAVLAALPYAIAKIPGLYALNAAFLAVLIMAYHAIATRLLRPRAAWWTTIVLPFAVPLYSYAAMELPHLLSAGLLLAAFACFANLIETRAPRSAFGWALATGLLSGLSTGVRVQNVIAASILVASAWLHAPRRREAVGGQVVALGACLGAMGWLNANRFGTFNPFTYGPLGGLGAPPAAATATHFFAFRFVAVCALLVLALLVAHRHSPARRKQTWGAAVAIVVVLVAVPTLRETASWMAKSAFSFLVNAAAFFDGWDHQSLTFGWINKPLLSSSPWLIVGLAATLYAATRSCDPLPRTLAWVCLSTVLFLSRLNPNPIRPEVHLDPSVLGFLSLSPRYLVEVMPMLFLLGWWLIRDARLGALPLLLGLAPGAWLYTFFSSRVEDDNEPVRAWLLMSVSIGLAMSALAVVLIRRSRKGNDLLAVATGLCVGYAAAVTLGVDTVALDSMGATNERWTRTVLGIVPDKLVIVGAANAKDPIFGIRSTRDAVYVDYTMDDMASLLDTLRAVRADGRPIYYFGLGLERATPTLEREYDVIQIETDPLLWRLDPRAAPPP